MIALLIAGMSGGCAAHHTQLRDSFVKVRVSTTVNLCGTTETTKEPRCVNLMRLDTSGSGAIVDNQRILGGTPRTLVLTAAHVCVDSDGVEIPEAIMENTIRRERFIDEPEVVTSTVMHLLDSHGHQYPVREHPWARNVPADICIIETSINAPALHISGVEPEFGEEVINIAAPGGFMQPSASGGAVYIIDGRYSGSSMMGDKGVTSVYTLWAIGGSSGSPIMNNRGEMVGMVSAISTQFWPRSYGHTRYTGEPLTIRTYSAASPLTLSPTLEQIRHTVQAARAAMRRGEPFIYPQINATVSLPEESTEENSEGDTGEDTGEIIYPIFIEQLQ